MGRVMERIDLENKIMCHYCCNWVPVSTSCIISVPNGEDDFERKAICENCMNEEEKYAYSREDR